MLNSEICTFLEGNLCSIHKDKPQLCKDWICDRRKREGGRRMKLFIVGFRRPAQYRRHQVIAEDEDQAIELLTDHYKKLGLIGTAEILDTSPHTLSSYWTKAAMIDEDGYEEEKKKGLIEMKIDKAEICLKIIAICERHILNVE